MRIIDAELASLQPEVFAALALRTRSTRRCRGPAPGYSGPPEPMSREHPGTRCHALCAWSRRKVVARGTGSVPENGRAGEPPTPRSGRCPLGHGMGTLTDGRDLMRELSQTSGWVFS